MHLHIKARACRGYSKRTVPDQNWSTIGSGLEFRTALNHTLKIISSAANARECIFFLLVRSHLNDRSEERKKRAAFRLALRNPY